MSNVIIEVNKKVELIQVILYLADRQDRTKQVVDNPDYIPHIKQYFHSFSDHKAVLLTRELIDKHSFIHIKPLRAVLNIDNIIEDTLNPLYNWACAVLCFCEDTNFNTFFENNTDYYEMIINTVKSFHVDKWVSFTEEYFKSSFDTFNLILCPVAGNYGFTLDVPAENNVYTVSCMPYYDEVGEKLWYPDYFAKGVAHEFAHCFVNPVVEGHLDILSEITGFFNAHKNMYDSYNVNYAVMNEYFVRAFAIRFMEFFKDDYPDFDIYEEMKRQRSVFIYIDKFIELLKEFETLSESFEQFYLKAIRMIRGFNS